MISSATYQNSSNSPAGIFSWSDFGSAISEYLPTLPRDPLNNTNSFYFYKVFVDSSGNPGTIYYRETGFPNICGLSPVPAAGYTPIRGYIAVRWEGVATNNTCARDIAGTGWEYTYLQ